MIGTRAMLNASLASTTATAGPPGTIYLRDDFVDGPGPGWRAPTVASQVGATCLYPEAPQTYGGLLRLSVEQRPSACAGGMRRFRGELLASEQRFPPPFRVRARARVAAGPGVVSALFTYADPFDGTPHFENDFEFPGDHTTRTFAWLNQFGPWTLPDRGDARYVPLGVDAAGDFHVFEIDVYPGGSVWRVDDVVVRESINYAPAPPQTVNINIWWKNIWPGVYGSMPTFSARGRGFDVDWIEVAAIEPYAGEASQ